MEEEWQRAIERGELAAVRHLLERGAAVDSKDRYGQTALMIAATRGQTEVVKFLIQNGAELNLTAKYHLSALMLAVVNGHEEIVRLLTDAGADTQIRGTGAPGFSGKTALELAEEAGRGEIAAILRRAAGRITGD